MYILKNGIVATGRFPMYINTEAYNNLRDDFKQHYNILF